MKVGLISRTGYGRGESPFSHLQIYKLILYFRTMSILGDFSKQHIDVKAFIFGTILITPFWYISIYLFHPIFFKHSEIYLPIIFSFCLTLCSAIINIISWVVVGYSEHSDEKDEIKRQKLKDKDNEGIYSSAIFTTILIIAVCIIYGKKHHENFYEFLKGVFYTEIWILPIFLVLRILQERYKNKTKKSEGK